MAYYPIITPCESGQEIFYEVEDYPVDAENYKLNTDYSQSVKSNKWFYIQTESEKCGAFRIYVWFESPNISLYSKPVCSNVI